MEIFFPNIFFCRTVFCFWIIIFGTIVGAPIRVQSCQVYEEAQLAKDAEMNALAAHAAGGEADTARGL